VVAAAAKMNEIEVKRGEVKKKKKREKLTLNGFCIHKCRIIKGDSFDSDGLCQVFSKDVSL